jgi:hypothetical protein
MTPAATAIVATMPTERHGLPCTYSSVVLATALAWAIASSRTRARRSPAAGKLVLDADLERARLVGAGACRRLDQLLGFGDHGVELLEQLFGGAFGRGRVHLFAPRG